MFSYWVHGKVNGQVWNWSVQKCLKWTICDLKVEDLRKWTVCHFKDRSLWLIKTVHFKPDYSYFSFSSVPFRVFRANHSWVLGSLTFNLYIMRVIHLSLILYSVMQIGSNSKKLSLSDPFAVTWPSTHFKEPKLTILW